MQSTGHTSTHDLSFVPMHGSVMMYAIAAVRSASKRNGWGKNKTLVSHPRAVSSENALNGAMPANGTQDIQQDYGADERHQDAVDVETGQSGVSEFVEYPTADERADDADDQVAEKTV